MLTLYGKKTSINVRKVLWLLELSKTPYDHNENVSIEEIKSLNPNGLVPIIKDAEFILWESNSILRYIANKYNMKKYYPTEPIKRANVDRWLDWQASDFNSSWVYAFQALVRKSKEHQDKKLIEQSKQKWNNSIQIIDEQLNKTKYIASENFSIADIVIAVSLNRWYLSIGKKGLFKNVDKYFDNLFCITGFKDIVSNEVA